jgi:predicted permease
VLAIGLLAVALAANTLMFAVADSLVFHRAPYSAADRLVELQERDVRTGRGFGTSLTVPLLDEWRNQRDLFEGLEGHLHKVIFLSGSAGPELVPAADVTVGLTSLLGVRPRWGRPFAPGDERPTGTQAVLISESLARQRFGDPARAVGQTMETTADPLMVIGVMPAAFRYPGDSERIWRALDPRGPLAFGYAGVTAIARLRSGISFESAAAIAEHRSADIGRAAGARSGYTAVPVRLRMLQTAAESRRLLLVLLGAALCLLLVACANVASLELASAVSRARTYAIQLAVGASRGSLVRTALIEGALVMVAAVTSAAFLATLASGVLVEYLPPAIVNSANPIDLDTRAGLFMIGIGALTWMLASLPVVAFASRANLLEVLKLEGSAVATSRGGALFRRVLTVAQVALAVLLLVGSVLYVRSYLALLDIQKGFDSSGVVSISLTIPPQSYGTAAERQVAVQTILDRVRARPGVAAAFEGAPPPSMGDSPMRIDALEIDDRPPEQSDLALPKLWVEPDYFEVLGIPLLAGRMFEPGEPPTNVIISEALATRLWPGGNAVGHRFRESPKMPWKYVIGIVRHVRLTQDGTTGPSRYFQLYARRQPPPPPPAGPGPRPVAVRAFGFLTVTARVDSRARALDLYQTVRSVDPRNILKLEFADDQYARQFADRLFATRVVSGFGALAFVVAAAGIYGLMAFLVASRAREMGIRSALGADARDIRRLVLGSSLRLVTAGALIGVAAAIGLSRWVQSQLFGVRPTDPVTLIAVTLGVMAVALLATWQPARQASRIDPRELLKG